MATLRFTDGVNIDTSGKYRIIELGDGLYVTGQGSLCPIDTRAEGEEMIRKLSAPDAEIGNEMATLSDAERLARAVLLFFEYQPWDARKQELWFAITGRDQTTTRALCDFAREIRQREELSQKLPQEGSR